MKLEGKLKELQNVELEKPNSVFSMYLNTDPADPEGQGSQWRIQLKNGLNSFENYLERSDDKEELKNFRKVRKQVDDYVNHNHMKFQKSVILFASPDQSVWFAESLQMRVRTEFFWQESPVTDQLYQLKSMFPKLGIILVQQSQVKVIEAELGSILNTEHYELDIDTEDWRQHAGPRPHSDTGKGGKNLQTDHFDERFKANQKRWYKSIAPKLDKLAKDHGWMRIYIAGDKDEAKDIAHYMNKPIDKLENRNILEHDELKVIEQVVA
ncbi:VLRF1 family aeRF1-type release factor [Aquibacillus koreensis]|uniref:VLRF1 family aeRF1-type release factor n=1 Tax=Aquibacillus koreensis TaxID=279446 RepID=A0A9X4AHX4_9BACI|nr:VLRF1 family aeRF1-type release factor [Aquibacillus koreensis]MCT2535945.1 VLRF1 family aeRF1-type release factor [Aquibacillus koreensis]MDC3420401.1 VLRF1 family aeRF1-type release factor [Aquibacillus koreensis]